MINCFQLPLSDLGISRVRTVSALLHALAPHLLQAFLESHRHCRGLLLLDVLTLLEDNLMPVDEGVKVAALLALRHKARGELRRTKELHLDFGGVEELR